MKKKMIALAVTTLACGSVFAACSGGGSSAGLSESDIIGKWKLKSMKQGDEKIDAQQLIDSYKEAGIDFDESSMGFEFKEGGVLSANLGTGNLEEEGESTWKITDGKLTITSAGTEGTGELKNGELIFKSEDIEIVMTK